MLVSIYIIHCHNTENAQILQKLDERSYNFRNQCHKYQCFYSLWSVIVDRLFWFAGYTTDYRAWLSNYLTHVLLSKGTKEEGKNWINDYFHRRSKKDVQNNDIDKNVGLFYFLFFLFKRTLMQIWKSPYKFVFVKIQCPGSFAFLVPRILELFAREVCKFLKK